jgi:hypothetical protein
VPFQTTTELLLKLPPFTVSANPPAPAVALFGEIEVTSGVAGQPPQQTTGSNKIANAPKIADIFIVAIGVHRHLASFGTPPSRSNLPLHHLPLMGAFAALAALALAVSCRGFFQNPTLTSISISPAAPMVELGQTTPLQAFGSYDDGSRNQITSGLSWSSSDPTTASIGTTSGVLSGVQTRSVTITADAQGLSSTATATVFIVISAMSLEPTNPSMSSSGTQTFTVYGTVNGALTNISSGATVVVEQAGAMVTEAHRLATLLEERLPEELATPAEVITHLESLEDHEDVHLREHYTGKPE